MAKFKEKFIARKLRKEGRSIGDIAKLVNASKSSVSIWCSDIFLSEIQRSNLYQVDICAARRGSVVANENRKRERLIRLNFYKLIGIKKIGELSERELFLIGAALYWAEGGKNQRKVVFINSDPKMILLWVVWVIECLKITKERLVCRVEINEKCRKYLNKIENYWSNLTGIPITQFRKASLKHSRGNKVYKNNISYRGSLQLTVKRGTNLNYEILGYIEGLARFVGKTSDKI